ncbi:MAG TPA: MarR family transcriptional regulator [Alphaproteobacteria bacterium]|nr:MarR family transcriptional regulator [Alphaproteobacteria bacterium]
MARSRAVSPLDAHLGYWLRFVSNQVSQAFAAKLAGQDVTAAEWVLLRELYDGDAAPSVLADRLGMTRGAISKLADRLSDKTLLIRTAETSDKRYQSLALTAAGRKLVPALAALADQNDAEFFGDLAAAERRDLKRLMQAIARQHGLKTIPID